MTTAREVYSRCLDRAGLGPLDGCDHPYPSPDEHAARQPPRARAAFERAVRFAWLLSKPNCLAALREAALLLGGRVSVRDDEDRGLR